MKPSYHGVQGAIECHDDEFAAAGPKTYVWAGRDPFDRILLAQAKVERPTFLTADRRLLTLGYDWVADATR